MFAGFIYPPLGTTRFFKSLISAPYVEFCPTRLGSWTRSRSLVGSGTFGKQSEFLSRRELALEGMR
jgi:hypothetical protein